MPELTLTQFDYLPWLFLQLAMTYVIKGLMSSRGIKSWLIIEKAKADSPTD